MSECWLEISGEKHLLTADSTFFCSENDGADFSIRAIDAEENYGIVLNNIPMKPGSDRFSLSTICIEHSQWELMESVFVVEGKDCNITDIKLRQFQSTDETVLVDGQAELMWPGEDPVFDKGMTVADKHAILKADYEERRRNSFSVGFRFSSGWIR